MEENNPNIPRCIIFPGVFRKSVYFLTSGVFVLYCNHNLVTEVIYLSTKAKDEVSMNAIMSASEYNFIFLFVIIAVIATVCEILFGEFHRNKTPFWSEESPLKKDDDSHSLIKKNESAAHLSRQEHPKKDLKYKSFLAKDFLARLYKEGYATDFNRELINKIQINASDEKN